MKCKSPVNLSVKRLFCFKSHWDVVDSTSDVMAQIFGEREIHHGSPIGIYQSPFHILVIVY